MGKIGRLGTASGLGLSCNMANGAARNRDMVSGLGWVLGGGESGQGSGASRHEMGWTVACLQNDF